VLATTTAVGVASSYLVAGAASDPTPAAPAVAAPVAAGSSDPAEIERLIAGLERRAATADAVQLTLLARLHAQRGRLTGDLTSYERAVVVLDRAVALAPRNHEFRIARGAARATLHDFRAALDDAEDVLAADPDDLAARGLAHDARLELGRYEEARADIGILAAEAPANPGVLLRRGQEAFYRGDLAVAGRFLDRAYDAALDDGEFGPGLAQYLIIGSSMAFDAGRYARAETLAEQALGIVDGWHVALESRAVARAALGNNRGALADLRRVAQVAPSISQAELEGAILEARGDRTGAARVRATIDGLGRPGPVGDQELAMAWANAGRRVDDAVAAAQVDLARRPAVSAYDTLAWALHAAGRDQEARAASDRARRLGTKDPVLLYHAGMISLALEDQERAASELAAALALSPAFHPVDAPHAREVLARLR
jgi:tetratricopeptide (TPR) repeat protein